MGFFVFVTMFRLTATVDPEGRKAAGPFSRPFPLSSCEVKNIWLSCNLTQN